MTDLRERLERRSEGFELEPGALQRTLDRGARIRLRRRIAAGAVALVLGAAGVIVAASALPRHRPVPVGRGTPTEAPTPTIQQGVYWTAPVTRADLLSTMKRAGFTAAEAERYYFSQTVPFDRTIRFGLVIQEGFWFQTARADNGRQEAGWSGNFRIVGPHKVHALGYGCTITYRFSVSDRTLRLDVLRETGKSPDCGPGDLVAQTAIFDTAPFVRTG